MTVSSNELLEETQNVEAGKIELVKDYETPGLQLRREREKQGISIEDLAARLRLSAVKIRALENDEYESLPSEIFAQGYIRQCAKALALNGDKLIEDFNHYMGSLRKTTDQFIEPTRRINLQQRSNKTPVLWGVLFVLIAIGVAAYWFSRDVEPSAETSALFDQELSERQAESEELAQTTRTVLANRLNPVAEVPATPEEVDLPVASDGDVVESSAVVESQATDQALTAVPTGTDQLSIELTEDCWIEVIDRDGELDFKSLAAAGDNLELQGQAPFTIKFGNARGASLSFNGKPFDIPVLPGRKTVEFTVAAPKT